MKQIAMILAACLFLSACAQQVPRTISRPWNRTLSDGEIPLGSTISVIVECQSTPLLGSERLVEKKISELSTSLLSRRGFIISDQNYQYRMKVLYETQAGTKEFSTISTSSSSSYAGYYRNRGYWGYGTMLAQSISASVAQNSSSMQSTSIQYDVYRHIIACELYDLQNQLVWKNDTFKSTSGLNILDVYTPLMQMAFSSLPTSNEVVPRVPKLKTDRFKEFGELYIGNRYFMCPALPNYITALSSPTYESYDSYEAIHFGIMNPNATLAFLDLLETAEYAIPSGDLKAWSDPMNSNIWASATLIGKYFLGDDTFPINVVIDLKGTPGSYVVKKCRVVSDGEFVKYQARYDLWINTIRQYYDFFDQSAGGDQ